MGMFNLSASGMIFASKLLDNIGTIAGFYFLVRLIFIQPTVSFLFFFFAVDCVMYWTSMWDNSSLVPKMTAELKSWVNIAAGGKNSYVLRIVRSVPCIGVKVGGFRSMERNSTVIYLDFVLTNVAIMLITFH